VEGDLPVRQLSANFLVKYTKKETDNTLNGSSAIELTTHNYGHDEWWLLLDPIAERIGTAPCNAQHMCGERQTADAHKQHGMILDACYIACCMIDVHVDCAIVHVP